MEVCLPSTKLADYTMHNRNVLLLDVVDYHLADLCFLEEVAVPEEEKVASLEGGLHGAG